MLSFTPVTAIVLWLFVSLMGGWWLGTKQLDELHNRFFQDSSIALRQLSQKTAQHDAVLVTLGAVGESSTPAELISELSAALPQLRAIGQWHEGRWRGSATHQPSPLGLFEQAR